MQFEPGFISAICETSRCHLVQAPGLRLCCAVGCDDDVFTLWLIEHPVCGLPLLLPQQWTKQQMWTHLISG